MELRQDFGIVKTEVLDYMTVLILKMLVSGALPVSSFAITLCNNILLQCHQLLKD